MTISGYPIANDYMYNSTAFGPEKGKGGVKEADEMEVVLITPIISDHCRFVMSPAP